VRPAGALGVVLAACGAAKPAPTDPRPATAPPACMPTGHYDATFDFAKAKITPTGDMSMDFCLPTVQAMPRARLGRMDIDFDKGQLVVHWPALASLEFEHECEVDVTAGGANAHLVFDGTGATGTIDFAVGATNNPAERGDTCVVKGVTLTLKRARP
jgi:hypothetical protein